MILSESRNYYCLCRKSQLSTVLRSYLSTTDSVPMVERAQHALGVRKRSCKPRSSWTTNTVSTLLVLPQNLVVQSRFLDTPATVNLDGGNLSAVHEIVDSLGGNPIGSYLTDFGHTFWLSRHRSLPTDGW